METPNRKPDQDLLRLLALKRHEGPPPGFFDRLPTRVLVNIRAGAEVEDLPWWSRFWEMLVREPMVASSYVALGMGILLFGVSVFETAVGHEPSTALALPDTDYVPTGLAFPATSSLPEGVIYRATLPDNSIWVRAEGVANQYQNAAFTRAGLGAPEPVEALTLRLPR